MVVWNSMLLNWNEVEVRDAKIINILLDVVKQHFRFILNDFSDTIILHLQVLLQNDDRSILRFLSTTKVK